MRLLCLIACFAVFKCVCGNTLGCNKGEKFMDLEYSNAVAMVFCHEIQEITKCATALEPSEWGFFAEGGLPCKIMNNDNIGESIIAYFSKVTVDAIDYYYQQPKATSGLFLTKDLPSQLVKGAESLQSLVNAVVPKTLSSTDSQPDPALTCYDAADGVTTVLHTEATNTLTQVSVYCEFVTNQCNEIGRACAALKVRTKSTALKTPDGSLVSGTDVEVENNFVFLKNTEQATMNCGAGTAHQWFKDSTIIDSATSGEYTYTHDSTNEPIIQCIVETQADVFQSKIWNVFTVTETPSEATVSDNIDVTAKEDTTFDCTSTANSENFFPYPMRIWKWSSVEDESVESLKVAKATDSPTFAYEKIIEYSDKGKFICYQFNGIGTQHKVKEYSTVYVVKTEIENITPVPVNWYEYITSVPEVYYMPGEILQISCNVTKEAHYDIWWKLEEQFFKLKENDSGEKELAFLDSSNEAATLEAALEVRAESGWSLQSHDIAETLGYMSKQELIIENYKENAEDPINITAILFLVVKDDISTVGQLTTELERLETLTPDSDDFLKIKTLGIRLFTVIQRPFVKGPLNQIQSEKKPRDMVMNCRTNGIPPAYIYMLFNNTKKEVTNLTAELEKEDKLAQFTRYRIDRKSDILTTLTISPPKQEDEGIFTCFAINRETSDANPVIGPDADVYIMEPCSERDQFCFPNQSPYWGISEILFWISLLWRLFC